MIKAIIFDWDGVIVDSMPIIALGIQETASSYGVKVSIDDILDNYIQPRDAYYRSIGIDTTNLDELNKRHWEAILKHRQPAPIFPEVADILHFLKDNNLKLGFASTAETFYIIEQLELFGLEGIFSKELIMGGEISKKEITKEEKLIKFLSAFNLPLDEILYVGDLPSDIKAAKTVGVKSAGMERREKAREKLSLLKPDYLFSSLNDLKILLKNNI